MAGASAQGIKHEEQRSNSVATMRKKDRSVMGGSIGTYVKRQERAHTGVECVDQRSRTVATTNSHAAGQDSSVMGGTGACAN